MPAHSAGFRKDIEGLRAIAVLLVVLYHAHTPLFRGGFVGVDVFFVLSGYLITGLLAQEMERTGRIDLLAFYVRRVLRLLPAALVVILATLVLGALLCSPSEMQSLARTALFTSAYASNLWFIRSAGDYFSPDAETNPLLHTWSLAVEEQFYIVWPVLLVLIWRLIRRDRLWLALATLSLLSFAGAAALTPTHQPYTFYGTPFRAWEFGVGGVAALVPLTVSNRTRSALGWVGIAAILASGLFYSTATVFPGVSALLPVGGTALALLAGGRSVGGSAAGFLSNAVFQWLGRHSYSWYLWHWPVLVFGALLFPDGGALLGIFLAAISLGLSALTYVAVESPMRRHSFFMPRKRLTIATAAAMTVVLCASMTGLIRHAESAEAVMLSAQERELDPRLERCRQPLESSEVVVCSFGKADADTVVALFGDSHAEHWAPALIPVVNRRGWRLDTYLKMGCPWPRLTVESYRLNRDFTECDAWRNQVIERLKADPADLVVLAASAMYMENSPQEERSSNISVEEWQAGARRTIAALVEAGSLPFVVRDVPFAGFNVPNCMTAPTLRKRIAPCAIDSQEAFTPGVWTETREVLGEFGLSTGVDLIDRFCPGGKCQTRVNGFVAYRDSRHVSAAASRSLSADFERALDAGLASRK